MFHKRLVGRLLWQARRQAAIFVLCTALSLVSLVALGGFAHGVRQAMIDDARRFQAADVVVNANRPFSPELTGAIQKLGEAGQIRAARVYEFYSVVRVPEDGDSLLSHIKVVGPGYPFYGRLELASGRPLASVLTPGSVVVAPGILERLQIGIGRRIQVGANELTIVDTIVSEPDRPVDLFSLGPRVMASLADLEVMNLVEHGSRVRHGFRIQVIEPADGQAVLSTLADAARDQERVESAPEADSRLKQFFDNLLFFLGLVGIFTLILAGLGIQSSLAALLKDQEATIASLRTLGAGNRFVTGHFLALTALLGLAGTALGLAVGLGLQPLLPVLFEGLVPVKTAPAALAAPVMEGTLLGLGAVCLFAFLPLYRLRDVRPAETLQAVEVPFRRGPAYLAAVATVVVFFVAMILWQIQDLATGLYFVAGTGTLVGCITLITRLLLTALRRWSPRDLALRQALRGLFRPRNATAAIIITLASALTVIFATFLIERNLDATFVQSFPDDTPNLFLLDIQTDQQAGVAAELGPGARFYPVVRARISAINDRAVDAGAERRRRSDNLARTFNLTYRETLLDDEMIKVGRGMFRSDWPADLVQVSVLERVRRLHPFAIGDRITFQIQGVPLTAVVASIRERTRDSLNPFFYFVFQPKDLATVPQTIFAALHVPADQIHGLQNRIAARFANISAIDAGDAARLFGGILRRLSRIVRFFAAFSMIAGLLITISSVLATRAARIREAVYYKILGARQRFVVRVFALENVLIGLIGGAIGLAAAQAAGYLVCTRVLEIGYRTHPAAGLAVLTGTVALVVAVGMAASRGILSEKPDGFLRRQDQGM